MYFQTTVAIVIGDRIHQFEDRSGYTTLPMTLRQRSLIKNSVSSNAKNPVWDTFDQPVHQNQT
jgi:hypothetical protein